MKKASFVATGVPRVKQAPANMRKEEHQFVIDGYLVNEVLAQLPPSIKILGGCIRISTWEKSGKIIVPNAARKCGVTSMHIRGSNKTAQIVFDSISKEAIKRKLAEACKVLNFPPAGAAFRYLLLSNGKGNVMFRFATKEIKPDETDLRKKLKVLGATEGQGQVQSVIADLNAKKYKCVIKEEPVKFVMCYKE